MVSLPIRDSSSSRDGEGDRSFSGRAARRMTHEESLVKGHRHGVAVVVDIVAKFMRFAASPRPPPNVSLEDGSWRSCVGQVLHSICMEIIFATIISFNLVIIVIETDSRAELSGTSQWISVASLICFALFVLEFAARAFVERATFLCNAWNRMDFVIVVTGVMELVVQRLLTQYSLLSMFRIARLLRLAKVLRMMTSLPELQKLMQMMLTCMRTLFWSFILTFLLMTTWSVVMVELVNPLMKDIVQDKAGCDDMVVWSRAYSTVMRSNLTLFQTMVVGDGWGRFAVPIIEAHPWTVVLFVPGFLVLVFCVLNLVIAVVVDTAAEARQNNDNSKARARDREERLEKAALLNIFESIDKDNCAAVTLEELQAGVENVPELRNKLLSMDIARDDLRQLFTVLDANASGEVDSEEFIETLSRMRSTDSKTAVMLIKHYVMDLMKRQQQLDECLADMKRSVDISLHALRHQSESQKFESEEARAKWNSKIFSPPPNPADTEEHGHDAFVSRSTSEPGLGSAAPSETPRGVGPSCDEHDNVFVAARAGAEAAIPRGLKL